MQNVASFEDKYTEALLKQQRPQRQASGKAPRSPSRRSGRSAAASPVGGGEATSDLNERVVSGYIFNPSSGRNIKIGGDTYIRMVEAGWRPDIINGTMKAPVLEAEGGPGAVKGGGKGGKKT